jgi:hypothetical protein
MRPSGLLLNRGQRKKGVRPSLRRPPRLAATSLAHAPAAARRCGPGHGAGVRFCPSSPLWTLTHARTARRPAHSTPATARGATSRPGARASPRCGQSHGALGCGRLGFKRTITCKNTPSTRRSAQHSTERGVERLYAELRWWRGQGHGAHGCGRPVPALTSTCNRRPTARRPVHGKVTHATAAARPETRRGGKDAPAQRAGGASRVWRRARRRGAGWSPALPANLPGPNLGENTGTTRLGVATAPGSRWQDATRRRPWGGGGATRSATGGSKARPHTETWQGDGTGGREKPTALTAGRRCSRSRVAYVDGVV